MKYQDTNNLYKNGVNVVKKNLKFNLDNQSYEVRKKFENC